MSELQNNEKWHQDRLGRITASRVAGILNISTAHQNRAGVLREMVRDHFGLEREVSDYVQKNIFDRGHEMENAAIAMLEKNNEVLVISTDFVVHPDHDWLGASPDGIISGTNIGVEAKNPLHQLKPLSEMPHYYAQIQMQCACCGFEAVWFVNRLEKDGKVSVRYELVPADSGWLEKHIGELRVFYNEFQEALLIPEDKNPHWLPIVTERDDPKWAESVVVYKAARDKVLEAEAILLEAKRALIAQAEGVASHGEGALVYRVTRRGSIGWSKLVKAHLPELTDDMKDVYRGKESQYWAVRLDAPPAANDCTSDQMSRSA